MRLSAAHRASLGHLVSSVIAVRDVASNVLTNPGRSDDTGSGGDSCNRGDHDRAVRLRTQSDLKTLRDLVVAVDVVGNITQELLLIIL